MSGKQEKKIRQLVRREQRKIANSVQPTLVNNSWDCFFQTISEMKLRYRIIIRGKNIRKEEQEKIQKILPKQKVLMD